MLNARVRMALQELNASIKALLEPTAPAQAHGRFGSPPDPTPQPLPEPVVPQVTVTLHGVGGCCSLALPAECMEKEVLRSAARALHLQPG
eukprot:3168664-Prorocentrum_lima.AAC.1